jgi:catechol 2,3-dioxygenase-like lactoylglutathione lyase family enzyme
MLDDGRVVTRLPAQDLQRARAFYADKLGLEPVEERPGGLLYRCSGCEFALFEICRLFAGHLHPDGVSKGTGEKGVWFRDSEGNMLGIGEPVRA